MSKSLNISPAVIYSAVQKSKIYNQDHLVSSLGYCQLRALSQITCTARSIEIVPRGKPPLKMGGPPLEFISIQPSKGGPPLEFINIQPLKRRSASRIHQPKRVCLQISSTRRVPPLEFININLKGLQGQFLWTQPYQLKKLRAYCPNI